MEAKNDNDDSSSSLSSSAAIRDVNKKREDYLSWPDYFMSLAFLSAMRSKDPCSQVGACIVNNKNRVVGIGYNGMPNGCSDDDFPWAKFPKGLVNKQMYVCHAEMNAIVNTIVPSLSLGECTIYVVLFPCNECAKLIIQSGIRKVFYYSDKNNQKKKSVASRRMLDAAGVTYEQHIPTSKTVVIDFESIDWDKVKHPPPQTPSNPKRKR